MPRLSRRSFLSSGAVAAGGALTSGLLPTATAAAAPRPRTGTIADVEHVIVLMQENRSFDHYYGTLGGVRGFGDSRALTYPGGGSVFAQPDPARSDGRVLSPWRLDTSRFDAQQAGDLDHSWPGTHQAWHRGAWDSWVAAKGEETMGYFTRTDIPWQYALADAFTVCDQYFCSIQGPTTPNRLYHWTGMIDPAGRAGGPAISNPDDYQPVYRWTTYPERLQAAGVSWQVYANDEVGDGPDGYVGDYGDNPLWLFQAYHDALASSDPAKRQLAERASLRTQWKPDSGQGHDVDHVLAQFLGDCAAGTLPTVSWVVAPYAYSEHPQARPVDGAHYTDRVLKGLWNNPELWAKTVVLLNFDENDGFFDHELPPFPVAGTAGEYVQGLPIGLGPRVPMTVVSPWSRGGWVDSQVFDHTSVLRFLEVVTGVREPNISDWRRAVCGDLTSCFDFTRHDPTVPNLPDTAALVRIADSEQSLPKVSPPPQGAQVPVKPEFASRRRRPLPYRLDATMDRRNLTVRARNTGRAAASLSTYDAMRRPFAAAPQLIAPGSSASWPAATGPDGRYDVAVHGPDGFLRRFRGKVGVSAPEATAAVVSGAVSLTLANPGAAAVTFTVAPGDAGGTAQTVSVPAGVTKQVGWPAPDGRYDVTVTAGELTHRFAGTLD